MYRSQERVKANLELYRGCPRGKERPVYQASGDGLVLALPSFQRMCVPSGTPAQKVTLASSECHKNRIVRSLAGGLACRPNWPTNSGFPISFQEQPTQGLKSRFTATLRIIVRKAKVNAFDRPRCLHNNFPIFETTLSDRQSDSEGGVLESLCLVKLCVEI